LAFSAKRPACHLCAMQIVQRIMQTPTLLNLTIFERLAENSHRNLTTRRGLSIRHDARTNCRQSMSAADSVDDDDDNGCRHTMTTTTTYNKTRRRQDIDRLSRRTDGRHRRRIVAQRSPLIHYSRGPSLASSRVDVKILSHRVYALPRPPPPPYPA